MSEGMAWAVFDSFKIRRVYDERAESCDSPMWLIPKLLNVRGWNKLQRSP